MLLIRGGSCAVEYETLKTGTVVSARRFTGKAFIDGGRFCREDYESAVAAADVDELQAKAAGDIEPEAYVTLDDTATLMYTSGTTGRPKGCSRLSVIIIPALYRLR